MHFLGRFWFTVYNCKRETSCETLARARCKSLQVDLTSAASLRPVAMGGVSGAGDAACVKLER